MSASHKACLLPALSPRLFCLWVPAGWPAGSRAPWGSGSRGAAATASRGTTWAHGCGCAGRRPQAAARPARAARGAHSSAAPAGRRRQRARGPHCGAGGDTHVRFSGGAPPLLGPIAHGGRISVLLAQPLPRAVHLLQHVPVLPNTDRAPARRLWFWRRAPSWAATVRAPVAVSMPSRPRRETAVLCTATIRCALAGASATRRLWMCSR